MSESPCPRSSELQAFARGELAEIEARDVERHLEQCLTCTAAMPSRLANRRATVSLGPKNSEPLAEPACAVVTDQADGLPLLAASYSFLKPAIRRDEIGRLGNYRVLRLLGRGGMGVVFHAQDLALSRSVALKVMKPELDASLDPWERFMREARTMAAIKHPHIATLYEVGHEDNVIYLAMEFLEGESLDAWLERGQQAPVPEIVRLGREIGAGLAAIHRGGLVHRDIKPANLWLEVPDRRIKILDFGLARRTNGDTHLTNAGVIVGTPAYMSPEQARGEQIDPRSDLFSLGCVLYVLCTGKEPFDGPNPMAQLIAQAVEEPQPIQRYNPDIPDDLAELVGWLLAKRPDGRPASAEDVVEALAEIEASVLHPQPKPPAGTSVLSRYRRDRAGSRGRRILSRRAVTQGAALLLLAVVAWTGVVVAQRVWGPTAGDADDGPVYLADLKVLEAREWPQITGPGPPRRKFEPMPDDDRPPPPPGAGRDGPKRDGPPPGEGRDGPKRGGPPSASFFEVISVDRKPWRHGIGMHASPRGLVSVSYALGKQYATFSASVCMNDSSPHSQIPVQFSVYGDGRLLWESQEVRDQADLQSCTLDIKGVDVLKLTLTSHDEDVRGAHAVWLDPYVSREAK